MSQYKQYILPLRNTTWGSKMEIRINRKARQPLRGRKRGRYNSGSTYAIDDLVCDNSYVFWFSLQNSNTGNTPAEGAWWTAAENLDFIQADQSQVLILDDGFRLFTRGGVSALKKFISRFDGKLTPDTRDFSFHDYLSFTGSQGDGTPINEDCTTQPWRTLLNRIFDDPTALYVLHVARQKAATMGNYNAGTTYHAGDTVSILGGDNWESMATQTGVTPSVEDVTTWIKAREYVTRLGAEAKLNRTTDYAVLADRSSNAIQIQTVKLTSNGGVAEAQSLTIEDLFPVVEDTDFAQNSSGSSYNYWPLYGGYTMRDGTAIVKSDGTPDVIQPADMSLFRTSDGAGIHFDSRVVNAVRSINDQTLLISLSRFLAIICRRMHVSFDEANDIVVSETAWSDSTEQVSVPAGPTGTDGVSNGTVVFTSATANFDSTWFGRGISFSGGTPVIPTISAMVIAVVNATTVNLNTPLPTTSTGIHWALQEDYNNPALGKIISTIIPPPTNGNILQNLYVPYQWLVNCDPRCNLHSAEMQSSTGLAWETTLATALERWARQTKTRISWVADQTNKRPRLRLIDTRRLNTDAGTTLTATLSSAATSATVASFTPLASATYAQITSGNGVPEIVQITGGSGTTANIARIGTGRAWPSGASIDPVRILPASPHWQLGRESERDQQIVSGQHVEIKYVTDSDTLVCPHDRGTPLSFEIMRRAKKVGPLGQRIINIKDAIQNASLGQDKQFSCWRTYTGGPNPALTENFIYGADATIKYYATAGSYYFYSLESPSVNFSLLNRVTDPDDIVAGSIRRDHQSVFTFPNGAVGIAVDIAVGGGSPTPDRNCVYIRVNRFRPTPANLGGSGSAFAQKFLLGYTGGAMSGFDNNPWRSDVTATDGSNVITTAGRFDQTDIYGALFQGQQIVLVDRGVYNAETITWGGGLSTITLDEPIPLGGTNLEMRIGGPDLNPEAWFAGEFLYYLNMPTGFGGALNLKRFQSTIYNDAWVITDRNRFLDEYWRGNSSGDPWYYYGGYSVSRISFAAPADGSVPRDDYGDALYSLAQCYNAELIGNFTQLTRIYLGVTAIDDTLTGYDVMDSISEYNAGSQKNFMCVGIEPDEFETSGQATTRTTMLEWPDFSGELDSLVWKKFGGGSSGGASSGGGSLGTSSGGSGGSITTHWQPDKKVEYAGAGALQIALSDIDSLILCTDATTTGLLPPLTITAPQVLVIRNLTGADFTQAGNGNFYVPNNGTWTLLYDGSATQSDTTMPAGWGILSRSS